LALPSSLALFHSSAPPDIYTLSLHDALPISIALRADQPRLRRDQILLRVQHVDRGALAALRLLAHALQRDASGTQEGVRKEAQRSEEHTSELQSLRHLVCRLLLEKKKNKEHT